MSLLPIFPASGGDFLITISSGVDVSLASLAAGASWDNESDLVFKVTGDIGGPIRQDIDTEATVKIVIEAGASVVGFGGDGGTPNDIDPTDSGEPGGNAIVASFACQVDNRGTLAGGGDGGGANNGIGGETASGGGGGAGRPPGGGGGEINGGESGAAGTATTGGAGGSIDTMGSDGGDLGDAYAIAGFSNVSYTGDGILTGGTD